MNPCLSKLNNRLIAKRRKRIIKTNGVIKRRVIIYRRLTQSLDRLSETTVHISNDLDEVLRNVGHFMIAKATIASLIIVSIVHLNLIPAMTAATSIFVANVLAPLLGRAVTFFTTNSPATFEALI